MHNLKQNHNIMISAVALIVISFITLATKVSAAPPLAVVRPTLPTRRIISFTPRRLTKIQHAFNSLNLRYRPLPSPTSAFVLDPTNLFAGSRGYVLSISRAKSFNLTTETGKYVVRYNVPGNDGEHFIQFKFVAQASKAYVVECEVGGSAGRQYSAHIQLPGSGNMDITADSYTDSNRGYVLFPVYAQNAGSVYVTFSSPMSSWKWLGCTIVPQK
ncbi:MAG: hypothetical protein ISR65_09130 [Bacteriovoracaceae bacterium]|nr:hypothetical protein [Bacteriovoracaceae bacterium]